MENMPSNTSLSVDGCHSEPDLISQMPLDEILMSMIEEYTRIEILEDLETRIEGLYGQLELDTATSDAHAILRLAAACLVKHQRTDSLEDQPTAYLPMSPASLTC